jgi:hypothetical protein
MKILFLIICSVAILFTTDKSLPNVFSENRAKQLEDILRKEAAQKSATHHLPATKKEWDAWSIKLKQKIISETGAIPNQHLPLNLNETHNEIMHGYTIKNISFQTRPGISATANLYVPDLKGKLPAVIVMMGHSFNGRFYDKYQAVGISLAQNGYVALCIDPWGSGERTTVHGVFEDHGDDNNLGSSLMDIGETLMGMQITDNIRGVDLLASLPYVDPRNIGATGSSGGGNQTIWLTAMDKRIKAAVPVVSAGTYESFVMGSPCICEVLPDALAFTEEAGVLSLIAPRALKMCNHYKDQNAAFQPREMIRSFNNALPIYKLDNKPENIAYETFDLPHGYFDEDIHAMIGWFNTYLKENKQTIINQDSVHLLPYEQLMTYENGKRDKSVMTTEQYCKQKGNQLKKKYLGSKSFNETEKRKELKTLLRMGDELTVQKVNEYSPADEWQRFSLETSDHKSIPVIIRKPEHGNQFVILSHSGGKQSITDDVIQQSLTAGTGIAIIDLSGTGETASKDLHSDDSSGRLRTLTKSSLLLGKTVMGEWVKELQAVHTFVESKFNASSVSLYGFKDAAIASLFMAAIDTKIDHVILNDAPFSYLFDDRDSIEYFSTGIHVPGFLKWGDVSLAAALAKANITFIHPVTMSGRQPGEQLLNGYKKEYAQIKKLIGHKGLIDFQ